MAALIEQMTLNTPPKAPEDNPESWATFNGDLLAATNGIGAGAEGATLALKKAGSCGKCHAVHK